MDFVNKLYRSHRHKLSSALLTAESLLFELAEQLRAVAGDVLAARVEVILVFERQVVQVVLLQHVFGVIVSDAKQPRVGHEALGGVERDQPVGQQLLEEGRFQLPQEPLEDSGRCVSPRLPIKLRMSRLLRSITRLMHIR